MSLIAVQDAFVIVSAIVIGWGDMAKPAHRFIGFDKRTGEVVWYNGTSLLPDALADFFGSEDQGQTWPGSSRLYANSSRLALFRPALIDAVSGESDQAHR